MTLLENAKKYYQEDYNCSETLLRACNETYNLQLDHESMKMMSGFGGGLYGGHMCGALIGLVAALSKMITKEKAHEEKDTIPYAVSLLKDNFESLTSSLECKNIRPLFYSSRQGCWKTVELGCIAFEKTLQELEDTID